MLPNYNAKSCTERIQALRQLLEESKQANAPRKKFSFASKKSQRDQARIEESINRGAQAHGSDLGGKQQERIERREDDSGFEPNIQKKSHPGKHQVDESERQNFTLNLKHVATAPCKYSLSLLHFSTLSKSERRRPITKSEYFIGR